METKIEKAERRFEEIVERETQLRDSSPEHTMDWYTYDNRLTLLKEVEDILEDLRPAKQKPVQKPVGKKDEQEVEEVKEAIKEAAKVVEVEEKAKDLDKVKKSPSPIKPPQRFA